MSLFRTWMLKSKCWTCYRGYQFLRRWKRMSLRCQRFLQLFVCYICQGSYRSFLRKQDQQKSISETVREPLELPGVRDWRCPGAERNPGTRKTLQPLTESVSIQNVLATYVIVWTSKVWIWYVRCHLYSFNYGFVYMQDTNVQPVMDIAASSSKPAKPAFIPAWNNPDQGWEQSYKILKWFSTRTTLAINSGNKVNITNAVRTGHCYCVSTWYRSYNQADTWAVYVRMFIVWLWICKL